MPENGLWHPWPPEGETGATLTELLVLLLVLGVLGSFVAPLSATLRDAVRTRQAAGFISSRFRLAMIEAVNSGANVGVVFDQVNGAWSLRVCRDGTRNGLRRAEIASGADPCFDGPHVFRDMFPGVDILVDPLLTGPAGEPGNADPVRFGIANIASFAPSGGCTPGSLFLRSVRGQQFAVRVSGANGRSRTFRYDAGSSKWLQL